MNSGLIDRMPSSSFFEPLQGCLARVLGRLSIGCNQGWSFNDVATLDRDGPGLWVAGRATHRLDSDVCIPPLYRIRHRTRQLGDGTRRAVASNYVEQRG